jgi:protein-histidine pros-kinase
MSLIVRINLALVGLFALAALALGIEGSSMLRRNASSEALREAGLMMGSALAIRDYTATEIVPLLSEPMRGAFLPQSVPSYAATQNFLRLREEHAEYSYKEATLNPTNPRDRATDWEADIVHQFRNDPKSSELLGERDTPMGPSLYLARPIHAKDECLVCHGLATAAPRTLVERYGVNNGFGWQSGEVIGAQVVSVPLASAADKADRHFRAFMLTVSATLAGLLVAVNVVLYVLLLRPLRRTARIADQLSRGETGAADFPDGGGRGEIATLARAFDRMRTSLDKALRLLES